MTLFELMDFFSFKNENFNMKKIQMKLQVQGLSQHALVLCIFGGTKWVNAAFIQ